MPYKFNPFTGNLDYYESGGGGGSSAFKSAVANVAALPSSGNSNGDTYVVLSPDHSLWTWNSSTSKWIKQFLYTPKRSLTLDGVSKRVTVGQNFAYDITSAFSISTWINFSSVSAYSTLVSKLNASNVGWVFAFDYVNLAFYLAFRGSGTNAYSRTGSVVSINTWYHVAVTYDGSQSAAGISIYVNGVLQTPAGTSNTWSGSVLNAEPAAFGYSGLGDVLNGLIDEYSFYTGAVLTAPQVVELYNGGVPSDLATLSFISLLTNWYKIGDLPDNYSTIYDTIRLAHATGVNLVNTDFTTDIA